MVKNKQMLFSDFPKLGKITSKVRSDNKKRIFVGGVRIGRGMYRTDEEMENYKKESLNKKLP